MKYFAPKSRKISINITSLIDILFLIIIFFSVTSRFNNEREKNLELPTSSEEQKLELPERLEIAVDKDGAIRVGENEYQQLSELEDFLKSYDGDKNLSVLLKIDKTREHGFVISVLDILKENGFEEVAFGTTF